MTDVTRIFNPDTRTLTNVQRRYVGQEYDADSTVLHFEYTTDIMQADDPSDRWSAYIIFDILDDDGNPLVYSFDGYRFPIHWGITSRVTKSRRVEYQLWFVRQTISYDQITSAPIIDASSYLLSEKDSIVLKPSIIATPPVFSPSVEPDIISWIDLWKELSIIKPVTQTTDEEGRTVIVFNTYGGEDTYRITVRAAPLDADDLVPIEFIPDLSGRYIERTETTGTLSQSNPVALKDYVDEAVSTSTATFLGTYDAHDDLGLTVVDADHPTNAEISAAIPTHLTFPAGYPSPNDYVFITLDFGDTGNANEYRRFKYANSAWAYEYTLNNTSFTEAQWGAINSGITASKVATYDSYATTKQNTLTFDQAPTAGSDNPVTSNGIKEAIDDLPSFSIVDHETYCTMEWDSTKIQLVEHAGYDSIVFRGDVT